MISKCANPDCSTVFRYLHEGKVYVIAPTTALYMHRPSSDLNHSGKPVTLKYAWLCSSCCRVMTIAAHDGGEIMVVRKTETVSVSEEDISRAKAIDR